MRAYRVFLLADEHDQLHTSVAEYGKTFIQAVDELPQHAPFVSLREDPHNLHWDICINKNKQ